jgi:hypothetical protein
MPRGKQFCPLENEFFDPSDFKTIKGTRIHNVEPLHRATDGVLVRVEGGTVFPVSERALEAPDLAPPPQEEQP